MPRKFSGTPPPIKTSRMLGETELDGRRWQLYERGMDKADEHWYSLKLICLAPLSKANYWIGWHGVEQRFSRTRDQATLAEHEPAARDWAESVLKVS